MKEHELLSNNYRNGGINYIRKSNLENHWVDFSKTVVDKLIKKYGDNLNLVIYWITDADNVSYYQIPYKSIRHLMTDEHLTIEANGEKRRWMFTITDNLLCIHANTQYSVDVSIFLNTPIVGNSEDVLEIISREEGESNKRFHKRIERDSRFIRLIKARFKELDPLMRCQICGFSFVEKYGHNGDGYIEAHHKVPLSKLSNACQTRESDIALVCANCHRMIHSATPELSVETVKKLIPDFTL